MFDKRLERIDASKLRLKNPYGVDATVFANEDVPVEAAAVDELSEMLGIAETIERVEAADKDFFPYPPRMHKVSVTPDFHKAAGIPVGTILKTSNFMCPQAIGNDVNCGMRLHLTSLTADKVTPKLDQLETALRHAYFEGGRDIAMNREQRHALLKDGMQGLLDTVPKGQGGLWDLYDEYIKQPHLGERMEQQGWFPAETVMEELDDFLGTDKLGRDGQIGSIGGGNHFVEVQRVEKILEGATAHAWGLKVGQVVVMVHTGSVSIGHVAGGVVRNKLRSIYPKSIQFPENGILPLPHCSRGGKHHAEFSRILDAIWNAANFAFGNRMFLGLIAIKALRDVCGDLSFPLLYDAPHNMAWGGGCGVWIHRKGACPAHGPDYSDPDRAFMHYGEPIMVPGSMGASSFILAGRGSEEAIFSASHGAGRALSRGDALRVDDGQFEKFMKEFRVVTPVDFRRQDIRMRRDIMDKKLEDIKKEAPYAYKGIGAVIKTIEQAGMAVPVAELKPIMTVKG